MKQYSIKKARWGDCNDKTFTRSMWGATRLTSHIVEFRGNHSSNKLHKKQEERIW